MTLGGFLKVYDKHEPFWVNYPDATGNYDAEYFDDYGEYADDVSHTFSVGGEVLYWIDDEIENITHDGEGVLTIELKRKER